MQTPPEVPSSDGEVADVPKAKIEPRRATRRLRLTKLWTAEDVKMPGNIFVIDGGDSSEPARLLVVDSWNSVVELQFDGKVSGRHELSLPPDSVVSTLRTQIDKNGKRYFAVFLTAQQQFHVFDQDWKPVLSFPAPATASTTA